MRQNEKKKKGNKGGRERKREGGRGEGRRKEKFSKNFLFPLHDKCPSFFCF